MNTRTVCRLGVLGALLSLVMTAPTWAEVGWYVQTSPVSTSLKSVDFVDASYGWICGDGGVILCTTDGGANWTSQNSGTTLRLNGISFLDRNLGFAVGNQSLILRTTDGGSSWETVQLWEYDAMPYYAVQVFDAQNVWAAGKCCGGEPYTCGLLAISTDGGTTWNFQCLDVPGSSGVIFDLSMTSPTAAHFAVELSDATHGSTGCVYSTTDSGASFTWEHTCGLSCFGVQFLSPTVGYAAFPPENGWVAKTENGGTNWVNQPVGYAACHISFVDELHGWAVGGLGSISRTQNGGATWSAQSSGTTAQLDAVAFVNASVGSAVGPNGLILHTVTGGEQGAGVLPAETLDQALRLMAPTPNPFSHAVQVRYSLREQSAVDLAVYDVSGRLFRVLQQGPCGPGEQIAAWDGVDMFGRPAAPGVYYVRLAALGEVRRQQVTFVR